MKTTRDKIDSMTANQLRQFIAAQMIDAGYDRDQVKFFLAGATLLGYLADDRASWARSFLVRRYIGDLDPFDTRIDRAGDIHIDFAQWQRVIDDEQRTEQELIAASRRAERRRQQQIQKHKEQTDQ